MTRSSASEIARVTKEGGMVLISVANYRMLHLCSILITLPALQTDARAKEDDEGASDARFPESKMHRLLSWSNCGPFPAYGFMEYVRWPRATAPEVLAERGPAPFRLDPHQRAYPRLERSALGVSDLKRVGNHFVITLRKGLHMAGVDMRLHEARDRPFRIYGRPWELSAPWRQWRYL